MIEGSNQKRLCLFHYLIWQNYYHTSEFLQDVFIFVVCCFNLN